MKSSARPSSLAESARIHLRVKHPKLSPTEITRTLSIEPEHTLDAGRGAASSAAESYWIAPLTFSSFEDPLVSLVETADEDTASRFKLSTMQMVDDEAVVGLAVRRLQSHQEFFQKVFDGGGTATLLLNVNKAGSMTIPPTLARKLAELCLGLELDWSDSVE